MSVYIACYLWGQSEFKAAINHITVDFGSSSLIPLPPPASPTPQLGPNHRQKPDNEPLPSFEGCGLNHNHSGICRTDDSCTRPSPFQRDVGGHMPARRGNWGGTTQGGTQEMGGPSSASQKQATTFVVACFSLFAFPPTTTNDIERYTAPANCIVTATTLQRSDDSETQRQYRQVHEDNEGDVMMGERIWQRCRRGGNNKENHMKKGETTRGRRGETGRRGEMQGRRSGEIREEEGWDDESYAEKGGNDDDKGETTRRRGEMRNRWGGMRKRSRGRRRCETRRRRRAEPMTRRRKGGERREE